MLLVLLVAGNAPAYRPLQFSIEVSADTDQGVEISGWCDIEIGNRTLSRTDFSSSTPEMEPVVVHGRSIDSCEVRRQSGQGTFTLILLADGAEIYRKTTREGETAIKYGPTMHRYSTRPPTMKSPATRQETK